MTSNIRLSPRSSGSQYSPSAVSPSSKFSAEEKKALVEGIYCIARLFVDKHRPETLTNKHLIDFMDLAEIVDPHLNNGKALDKETTFIRLEKFLFKQVYTEAVGAIRVVGPAAKDALRASECANTLRPAIKGQLHRMMQDPNLSESDLKILNAADRALDIACIPDEHLNRVVDSTVAHLNNAAQALVAPGKHLAERVASKLNSQALKDTLIRTCDIGKKAGSFVVGLVMPPYSELSSGQKSSYSLSGLFGSSPKKPSLSEVLQDLDQVNGYLDQVLEAGEKLPELLEEEGKKPSTLAKMVDAGSKAALRLSQLLANRAVIEEICSRQSSIEHSFRAGRDRIDHFMANPPTDYSHIRDLHFSAFSPAGCRSTYDAMAKAVVEFRRDRAELQQSLGQLAQMDQPLNDILKYQDARDERIRKAYDKLIKSHEKVAKTITNLVYGVEVIGIGLSCFPATQVAGMAVSAGAQLGSQIALGAQTKKMTEAQNAYHHETQASLANRERLAELDRRNRANKTILEQQDRQLLQFLLENESLFRPKDYRQLLLDGISGENGLDPKLQKLIAEKASLEAKAKDLWRTDKHDIVSQHDRKFDVRFAGSKTTYKFGESRQTSGSDVHVKVRVNSLQEAIAVAFREAKRDTTAAEFQQQITYKNEEINSLTNQKTRTAEEFRLITEFANLADGYHDAARSIHDFWGPIGSAKEEGDRTEKEKDAHLLRCQLLKYQADFEQERYREHQLLQGAFHSVKGLGFELQQHLGTDFGLERVVQAGEAAYTFIDFVRYFNNFRTKVLPELNKRNLNFLELGLDVSIALATGQISEITKMFALTRALYGIIRTSPDAARLKDVKQSVAKLSLSADTRLNRLQGLVASSNTASVECQNLRKILSKLQLLVSDQSSVDAPSLMTKLYKLGNKIEKQLARLKYEVRLLENSDPINGSAAFQEVEILEGGIPLLKSYARSLRAASVETLQSTLEEMNANINNKLNQLSQQSEYNRRLLEQLLTKTEDLKDRLSRFKVDLSHLIEDNTVRVLDSIQDSRFSTYSVKQNEESRKDARLLVRDTPFTYYDGNELLQLLDTFDVRLGEIEASDNTGYTLHDKGSGRIYSPCVSMDQAHQLPSHLTGLLAIRWFTSNNKQMVSHMPNLSRFLAVASSFLETLELIPDALSEDPEIEARLKEVGARLLRDAKAFHLFPNEIEPVLTRAIQMQHLLLGPFLRQVGQIRAHRAEVMQAMVKESMSLAEMRKYRWEATPEDIRRRGILPPHSGWDGKGVSKQKFWLNTILGRASIDSYLPRWSFSTLKENYEHRLNFQHLDKELEAWFYRGEVSYPQAIYRSSVSLIKMPALLPAAAVKYLYTGVVNTAKSLLTSSDSKSKEDQADEVKKQSMCEVTTRSFVLTSIDHERLPVVFRALSTPYSSCELRIDILKNRIFSIADELTAFAEKLDRADGSYLAQGSRYFTKSEWLSRALPTGESAERACRFFPELREKLAEIRRTSLPFVTVQLDAGQGIVGIAIDKDSPIQLADLQRITPPLHMEKIGGAEKYDDAIGYLTNGYVDFLEGKENALFDSIRGSSVVLPSLNPQFTPLAFPKALLRELERRLQPNLTLMEGKGYALIPAYEFNPEDGKLDIHYGFTSGKPGAVFKKFVSFQVASFDPTTIASFKTDASSSATLEDPNEFLVQAMYSGFVEDQVLGLPGDKSWVLSNGLVAPAELPFPGVYQLLDRHPNSMVAFQSSKYSEEIMQALMTSGDPSKVCEVIRRPTLPVYHEGFSDVWDSIDALRTQVKQQGRAYEEEYYFLFAWLELFTELRGDCLIQVLDSDLDLMPPAQMDRFCEILANGIDNKAIERKIKKFAQQLMALPGNNFKKLSEINKKLRNLLKIQEDLDDYECSITGAPYTAKMLALDKKLELFRTVADGSCVFHALLGQPNSEGRYEVEDVAGKRLLFCNKLAELRAQNQLPEEINHELLDIFLGKRECPIEVRSIREKLYQGYEGLSQADQDLRKQAFLRDEAVFNAYLRILKLEETWTTLNELPVVCRVLGINVTYHAMDNQGQKILSNKITEGFDRTVHIWYNGRDHFERANLIEVKSGSCIIL